MNKTGRTVSGLPDLDRDQQRMLDAIGDVELKRPAEEALREASLLQGFITDSKPQIIFTADAKGRINYVSEHWKSFTGQSSISNAKDTWAPYIHADDLPEHVRRWLHAINTGTPFQFEQRFRRADGDFRWHFSRAVPIRNIGGAISMWVGSTIDLSDRLVADKMLLTTRGNTLRQSTLDALPFSIIAVDNAGLITTANPAAEHLLGYQREEIIGQSVLMLHDEDELALRSMELSEPIGPSLPSRFIVMVSSGQRDVADEREWTYIRKNGERLPVIIAVTALRDEGGTVSGFLHVAYDITRRKHFESQLNSAKLLAEKANLAKSDFLSSMSHELRTPLNAILGFAQLLESSTPRPSVSQKRSIDQILKAGWYLLDLINEILDLAVIESGKLSLSQESVSMGDVMQECRTMMEPQAQADGIEVTYPLFLNPCFVIADRTRVKQVLFNLLSNAIKYNVKNGKVAVTCGVSGAGHIRIAVKDTGEGLTPDQLSRLFQPFDRLGRDPTVEGTGIGLVVCKRLVESMGGTIGADSTVGIGSVFWFELDQDRKSEASGIIASAIAASHRAQPSVKTTARTLLYVEDNPANLMLISDLVALRSDLNLISARNADRGIELARDEHPDVILMDINLPGISGLQALRILKEDSEMARIPVIALSANAMLRDIENGLAAGFFGYLTKPVRVREFNELLDMALDFSEVRFHKKSVVKPTTTQKE